MRPPVIRPGGGTRRMMDRAVTDLPHPDSPTMPTASPGPTSKETPSTARTTPHDVKKYVRRSSTRRRGVSVWFLLPGSEWVLAALAISKYDAISSPNRRAGEPPEPIRTAAERHCRRAGAYNGRAVGG